MFSSSIERDKTVTLMCTFPLVLILRNHHCLGPPLPHRSSPGQTVIFPFDWNIGSSSFTLRSTVATVTVCCDSVRFVTAKCAYVPDQKCTACVLKLQMEDYKCWLYRKREKELHCLYSWNQSAMIVSFSFLFYHLNILHNYPRNQEPKFLRKTMCR